MGAFAAIVVSLITSGPFGQESPDDPMDATAFLNVIDQLYSPIRELEFQYDSTVRPAHHKFTGKPFEITGSYRYSREGGYRLDYTVSEIGRPDVAVSTASQGGIQKTRTTQAGNPSHATVSGHMPGELQSPGQPGRLIYLTFVRDYAAQIHGSFQSFGKEEVNGHECLKVAFDQFQGVTQTFWIDLQRGEHPLKWEFTRGGKVHIRVKDVELARFKAGSDTEVWIPIKALATGHLMRVSPPPAPLQLFSEPVVVEVIAIRPETVKVNQILAANAMDVQFEKGGFVKDYTKGTVSIHGGPESLPTKLNDLSPQSAQEIVDQGIEEAETQVRGLQAGSPSRDPWAGARIWIVPMIALAVVALAGAYWLRRRLT